MTSSTENILEDLDNTIIRFEDNTNGIDEALAGIHEALSLAEECKRESDSHLDKVSYSFGGGQDNAKHLAFAERLTQRAIMHETRALTLSNLLNILITVKK